MYAKSEMTAAAAAIAFCMAALPAGAQGITQGPPEFVSYQGAAYLASDGVTPISGAEDITFRIYDDETDAVADAIWGEVHQDVPILNAVFNVYLGGGDELAPLPHGSLADLFTTAPLWLGIQIGLDEEITVRQRINSVPFAMAAKHVTAATHGAPPGTMMMYAGATAPDGWVFCNGQTLDAATNPQYAQLFAAIGTTWGGTGATSFAVPDMRNVTPIGAGNGTNTNTVTRAGVDAGIQPRPVTTRVGTETHTLTIDQMAAHTHFYSDSYLGSRASGERALGLFNAADGVTDTSRTTGAAGGGGAHNNVQPTMYLNFIIKL